jgi:hypothetical protein
MAALLEPGGVFASFGGPARLVDQVVEEAVRAARAPFLDSDDVPSPDGTPPGHAMQWPGTELRDEHLPRSRTEPVGLHAVGCPELPILGSAESAICANYH